MRLSTLKKRSEFQRVAKSPYKWVAPYFILQALPDVGMPARIDSPLENRFGFVITKKIGGAVVRNRIRRRFKGALGDLLSQGILSSFENQQTVSFVLIARHAAANGSFEDLLIHLRKAIQRLYSGCTASSKVSSKTLSFPFG